MILSVTHIMDDWTYLFLDAASIVLLAARDSLVFKEHFLNSGWQNVAESG